MLVSQYFWRFTMSSFSSPLSSPLSSPELGRRRSSSFSRSESGSEEEVVKRGGYLAGNRRFEEDLRGVLKTPSRRADKVIAALVQYQLNRDGTLQTRERLLIALQAEIADFETKEPKAYKECEAVCQKLFEKTMKEEQRIKALSPDVWEVQKLVEVWKERWSEIEVTDIPDGSGRPGHYKLTESDVYSLSDREVANQSMGETLGESRNRGTSPEYWIRLGHLVMLREKKYGRCLNCASAVIHSLITDPHYDDFLIEHVAAPESETTLSS
jgi:hypothetical protein